MQQGLLELRAALAVDGDRRPVVGPVLEVPVAEVDHLHAVCNIRSATARRVSAKRRTGSMVNVMPGFIVPIALFFA